MSDHDVYAATVKQVTRLQDEQSRIRHGLRELKIEAAAQSLHEANGNAARAAFARFEGHIEQLLAGLGLALLFVIGLGATAQAAPDPAAAAGIAGDEFAYLALLFGLGLAAFIVVFWARARIKGR